MGGSQSTNEPTTYTLPTCYLQPSLADFRPTSLLTHSLAHIVVLPCVQLEQRLCSQLLAVQAEATGSVASGDRVESDAGQVEEMKDDEEKTS